VYLRKSSEPDVRLVFSHEEWRTFVRGLTDRRSNGDRPVNDDRPAPGTSAGGVDLFPDVLSHAVGLTVIDHPAGFYSRMGFQVVGLIPDANGPGKPDILMAKRVNGATRSPWG